MLYIEGSLEHRDQPLQYSSFTRLFLRQVFPPHRFSATKIIYDSFDAPEIPTELGGLLISHGKEPTRGTRYARDAALRHHGVLSRHPPDGRATQGGNHGAAATV